MNNKSLVFTTILLYIDHRCTSSANTNTLTQLILIITRALTRMKTTLRRYALSSATAPPLHARTPQNERVALLAQAQSNAATHAHGRALTSTSVSLQRRRAHGRRGHAQRRVRVVHGQGDGETRWGQSGGSRSDDNGRGRCLSDGEDGGGAGTRARVEVDLRWVGKRGERGR